MNTGIKPALPYSLRGIVLSLLLLIYTPSYSQYFNFINYTTNNSKLPHDVVYRLRQDNHGYLWICTDDGLVRFDGMEMKKYDNGFDSRYIIATDEENGKIWAATWFGGLHILSGDSAYRIRIPANLDHGNAVSCANDIIVYNDLIIAYNFRAYVLLRYNAAKNSVSPYYLSNSKLTTARNRRTYYFPEDDDYFHFVKTQSHHLYAYNSTGIYEVVQDTLLKRTKSLIVDEIWESPLGKLYYRTGAKIYQTDSLFAKAQLVYSIPTSCSKGKHISSFRVLPSGNICLGLNFNMPDPAYYFIDIQSNEVTDIALDLGITSLPAQLITDKEGNIWLSTDGNGLYHIFDRKYLSIAEQKNFTNANINDLFTDSSGKLYIGTKGGIFLYEKRKISRYKGFAGHKNDFIRRFFITPDSNLAASFKNMRLKDISLPPQACIISRPQAVTLPYLELYHTLHYIFEISGKNATRLIDKKTRIDYAKNSNLHIPLLMNAVQEDVNGCLWICTTKGLWYFQLDGKTGNISFPKNCDVRDICFEKDNSIWVATSDGIYKLGVNRKIKEYWGISNGLTNTNVNCIYLQAPGVLWIGTQNGLFNIRNSKVYILKKRDGLISDDVSCFSVMGDNLLAIGTSKGISFIPLNDTITAQSSPELLIEKLTVNGINKSFKQQVNVCYHGTIALTYNVISFIYPELISYEYRLNDNEPWVQTQNKSLVLSNLLPGQYNMQLRAKKYNSYYSPILEINLTIASPWWNSWCFYVLSFASCVMLVYLSFRYRWNKQHEAVKIKQQFSELKLKALQTQLNPHFISNALNAIQYFALKGDELVTNKYVTSFANLTRILLETSRVRFVPLATELETIKLYLEMEQLRFENKLNYTIYVAPNIDTEKQLLPGMLLQPFVENSVNHGIIYLDKKKVGVIDISVIQFDGSIKIVIDDNGVGREKARQIKINNKNSYTSRGTEIVNEIKNSVNNLLGCSIDIETVDKYDSKGFAIGTRVTIFIIINDL